MNSVTSNNDKIHFKNLDALRALAAFSVIFTHIYSGWSANKGYPLFLPRADNEGNLTVGSGLLDNFFQNGVFGVDLFFLISGFLITYLLLVEKEQTGKINILYFFTRRGFRIWPLYFLYIALSPIFVFYLKAPTPDYISSLFFLTNYHACITNSYQFPFDHLWSICVEEHFYLVWPFIIWLVPSKKILNVFVGVIAFSILYRTYVFYYSTDTFWFRLYNDSFCRFDVLAIGAVSAYLYLKKPFSFNTSRSIRIMLLLFLFLLMCSESVTKFTSLYQVVFKKYIFIGLSWYLMLNFLFNQQPLFQPSKLVNYLGKISYGIYMYGNLFVIILLEKMVLEHNISNFYIYVILSIFATAVVSIISYEFFEKPFLKLKGKFEIIKTRS